MENLAHCVGQPTKSVYPCEYGEDLIEKNNNFLYRSRAPEHRNATIFIYNREKELREEEACLATRSPR